MERYKQRDKRSEGEIEIESDREGKKRQRRR